MESSLIILIVLFCATAFASATEMAIASVNRIRIKSRIEQGDKKAEKIYKIIEMKENAITTIVVLNNIVNITIPTMATILFINLFGVVKGPIYSAIVMTILILIFGEIIPKSFGSKYSEKYLNSFVSIISVVIKVCYPIAFLFIKLNQFVLKQLNKNEGDIDDLVELEDEILTMIEESSLEGKIEETEEELIRNAIEFNDIIVKAIIQPKRNVFMVSANWDNSEIFKQMSNMRFSRVPVYEDDKDQIIGILSEREFLIEYLKNEKFKVRTIIREAKFIPSSVKLSKILPELQKTKSQMAIVVDERATVQGIVTIEDILEELVGEIYDEHDDVVEEFLKLADGSFIVDGEMSILDFNELFDVKDIESELQEATLAGYVIELAEKIPHLDEVYNDNYFNYKIGEVQGNKIEKIIVTVRDDIE